tara:strand:+ start:220 stop:525 length:306 start_codon:yes stop_codon:yes gene_type:complete
MNQINQQLELNLEPCTVQHDLKLSTMNQWVIKHKTQLEVEWEKQLNELQGSALSVMFKSLAHDTDVFDLFCRHEYIYTRDYYELDWAHYEECVKRITDVSS